MSWRDGVSDQAQADLDGLLDLCLRCAVDALTKHGQVIPFGASVDTDGKMTLVAFAADDDETDPRVYSAGVIDGLRQQRDTLRAAAVTLGVRTETDNVPAIRVVLETPNEVSLGVDMPFSLRKIGKPPKTGDLRLSMSMRNVWSDNPTT